MDRSVPLDRLPDGLAFPPDLADRIAYDPQARRLTHRGFMSKADFDRLARLGDDWGYRRALEDLFRRCTLDPAPGATTARGRIATALARLVPALRPGGG